jgi:hypothetical protein
VVVSLLVADMVVGREECKPDLTRWH